MEGITAEALAWSLKRLKAWVGEDKPGKRFKQGIYRLLLLRQLGVGTGKATQLKSSDFKQHCRRFLLISEGELAAQTEQREHYFVPTACQYQKASGGTTDWAIGTLWTRCDVWQNNGLLKYNSVAGTPGTRAFKFPKDYASRLSDELKSNPLPALALAIFLFRDPSATGVNLAITKPADLVDLFLSVFNLQDPELKPLFDSSTAGFKGALVQADGLSPGEILDVVSKEVGFTSDGKEEKEEEEGGEESAPGESTVVKEKYAIEKDELKGASKHPVQVLLHGCPGSGKSYELQKWAAELSRSVTVVFHPETSYADFVGVYRPHPVYRQSEGISFVDEKGNKRTHGEPYITYEFVPGPLLEAYCLAKANPGESIALVIEELSRANASLVFGDMLQLLDRAEAGNANHARGESVYEIMPKPEISAYLLKHGIDADTDGKMSFPPNLHIWATMNRSDQNARQLDSAFLRRWDKRYLSYTTTCVYGATLVDVPKGQISWDNLRSRINLRLIGLAPEDKFVGPYFLNKDRLSSREAVADDLLGYLWNDVLKARARDFFLSETFSAARQIWIEGKENPFKDVQLP